METFDFGTHHPVRIGRFQMIRDFIEASGFLQEDLVRIITPRELPQDLLYKTHSIDYIERVQKISKNGEGNIDIDTPGFKGIYENALITSGGTVTGVRSIIEGEIDHFYSPTGGFHHAFRNKGGGFCIFNDLAAATIFLKSQGFERILIADFDVHHGNGTQNYFYEDSQVMIISFHEDPEWLYPHDGVIEDIGDGLGRGLNVNMPFPIDAGDAVYRFAFNELFPPLVDYYSPDFILFLPGFDAHYLDPLAQLNLTTDVIGYVISIVHSAAHKYAEGRLAVMSGGGYHPESFKWGSGLVMSELSGISYVPPPQKPPFEDDEEIWTEVRMNVARVKEIVFDELEIQ